jgi:2-dehydro-3-deoxygluconokinase
MIGRVQAAYPNARWYATTLREVLSANRHMWGALVTDSADWAVIQPREIGVLDRIGGGDGFVGGLLYGILKGWEVQRCAQFGWASGALAATMLTDYAQPADEEQLWSIWNGNARVKR